MTDKTSLNVEPLAAGPDAIMERNASIGFDQRMAAGYCRFTGACCDARRHRCDYG